MRQRNPLFDALADCNGHVELITKSYAGMVCSALKQMVQAKPDLTPEDIRGYVQSYRKKYPQWTVTPTALAKWMPTLQPTSKQPIRMEDM